VTPTPYSMYPPLSLREEHKLHGLENKVQSQIRVPNGHIPSKKRRKLHNKKLRNIYCLLNVVRLDKSRLQCAGHVLICRKRDMCMKFWLGDLFESGHIKN
jgi:hypothetical protein